MSFAHVALQDFPSRLWMLDGNPPFVDHTKFGASVTTPTQTNIADPANPFLQNNVNWIRTTTSDIPAHPQGLTSAVRIVQQPQDVGNSGTMASVYNVDGLLDSGVNRGVGSWVYANFNGVATTYMTATAGTKSTPLSANTWTWVATGNTGSGHAILEVYKSGTTTSADYVLMNGPTALQGAIPDTYWSGTRNTPWPKHAALIKGARSAVVVGNNSKLYFDAPIMKRGREYQSFTIEVTVRPIRKEDSNAAQQIFGTSSVMDGLVLNGTVLSFTTKYTNTGEARCEFDLEEYRAVTIAAGHTAKANYLYVNGDLVDEVEITPEQQADTYLAAGESLSAGTTTSANLLALNGLAIFPQILLESDIDQHYDEAADNMDEFGVASAYGAGIFALNSTTSIPLQETSYLNDADWYTGRISGTAVEYGQLVPQSSGGVSIPGLWETIVPLPVDQILSSVTLDWQGVGATVQTSLDGLTWSQPEKRSARCSNISDGFDTTGKFLYLRVSFPGGKVEDKSYFDGLVITAYGPINTTAPSLESRTITLTNGSIEADYDITEYHENWGIEIVNGTFSLSGASATASSPKTIQVWARKGTTGTFTDNLQTAATNWYTNDGTYQQAYQTDEWQLRTYTYPSGYGQPITFTGTGQIGPILIYPYVMTPEQVYETYDAYTGSRSIELTTSGTIGFVDLSHLVDIYEYNWAIESAG